MQSHRLSRPSYLGTVIIAFTVSHNSGWDLDPWLWTPSESEPTLGIVPRCSQRLCFSGCWPALCPKLGPSSSLLFLGEGRLGPGNLSPPLHHECKSPNITKSNPYFTDKETEAWEEQAQTQASFFFWGLVTKPSCTRRAFSIFWPSQQPCKCGHASICSLGYCGQTCRLESHTAWVQIPSPVFIRNISVPQFPQIGKQ